MATTPPAASLGADEATSGVLEPSDLVLPPPAPATITGLILAGGRARRMGGQDKGLIPLAGRPLIAWVIAALQPQVGRILISANRNQADYAALGFPVIEDEAGGAELAGFQGPLAGIAAAMTLAETPWLLTLPCDAPLPPADLASRLATALVHGLADITGARSDRAQSATAQSNNPLFSNPNHSAPVPGVLAVAWDGERLQPVHALLSRTLFPDLCAYLAAGGHRLETWQARHRPAITDFSDYPEAFFNLNAPGELRRLESLLRCRSPFSPS